MWPLTILMVWFAVAPRVAIAGKAEQRAEVVRLLEEIERLGGKGAWTGVERAYLRLLSLDRRGEKLDHDTHLVGAHAAQARGDSYAVLERLIRAQAAEPREDTGAWLATIQATNTQVSLEISPLIAGDVALRSIDAVVDPTQQRALAAARETLNERRYFQGLLPMGRYELGSKRFDLYGQPKLELTLWPKDAQASGTPAAVAEVGPAKLVLASTVALPPEAYTLSTAGVREALEQVAGIADVEVRALPPLRLYADFRKETLTLLELTTQDMADAVAKQLSLAPSDVSVHDGSVSILAGNQTAQTLARVEVMILDGNVDLDAIGMIRRVPDRSAPPPGLELALTDGADMTEVREAVAALLQSSAAAKELGLALR